MKCTKGDQNIFESEEILLRHNLQREDWNTEGELVPVVILKPQRTDVSVNRPSIRTVSRILTLHSGPKGLEV